MEEWPVEEKEVMKILVEVATSKREAQIVSRVLIIYCCNNNTIGFNHGRRYTVCVVTSGLFSMKNF